MPAMRPGVLAALIVSVTTFSNALAQYPPGVQRLDGITLSDLAIATDGTAYADGYESPARAGIYRLDPTGPVLVHARQNISDLEAAPDGTLWFSVLPPSAGLYQLRTDGSIVTVLTGDAGFIRDMTTATDGAIWYSPWLTQGVTRISPSGAVSTAGSGPIGTLAQGPDGSIWGLNTFDQRLRRFSAQGDTVVDVSISFSPLYATMAPTPDGGLWVAHGTPLPGMTRFDSLGQVVETRSLPPYRTAYIVGDGTIFLGTDAGIVRIANGTSELLALPALPPPYAPCYKRVFWTVGATPDGVMWFAESAEFASGPPHPGCVTPPNPVYAGTLRVTGFGLATAIPTSSNALLVALAVAMAAIATARLMG
jgi:hypothetical protein